ncbi:post-GPI attachment to proteins factor 4-like [Lineus longissimus]|uniref:post-GPI attachment to proteins factor 4-like n=1 Tax=Lineus longissimus TaxID=88925 RepID=UPI00315CCD22
MLKATKMGGPVLTAICHKFSKVVQKLTTHFTNRFCQIWHHQSFGIILKVYVVTFFLVLPILCYKLPYSIYFMESFVPSVEEMTQQELRENQRLTNEAWDYVHLNGIGKDYQKILDTIGSRNRKIKGPQNATVLITVISINRKEVKGYLTRTIAKLHRLIKIFHKNSGLRNYFAFALCNADTWPIDNRELYRVASTLNLPIFERFASPVRQINDNLFNVFGKEKDDYAYCLQESLNHNPEFVLLLEDDALPTENALSVIHRITSYSFQHYSKYEQDRIAYFKLFHPSRLLRYYSTDADRIPKLLALGAIFGTITFWIYLKFWKPRKHTQFLWIVIIFYFVLLFFCIGHPYVLRLHNLSVTFYQIVPAPFCCTPAMLYPSHSGKLMADYLRDTPWKAHPKDKIIDMYLRETGSKGWMVLPNLFDHIGLYSTLGKNFLNPYFSN